MRPHEARFCAVRRDLPPRPGDDPQALVDSLRGLADGYLAWLASEYDRFAHWPGAEVCLRNADLAEQWAGAVAAETDALGYTTRQNDPELWEPQSCRWTDGGGWHAATLRAEREEAETLCLIWSYAHILRSGPPWVSRIAESHLVDLIGHANFALGRLPPPVPIWRIPR